MQFGVSDILALYIKIMSFYPRVVSTMISWNTFTEI